MASLAEDLVAGRARADEPRILVLATGRPGFLLQIVRSFDLPLARLVFLGVPERVVTAPERGVVQRWMREWSALWGTEECWVSMPEAAPEAEELVRSLTADLAGSAQGPTIGLVLGENGVARIIAVVESGSRLRPPVEVSEAAPLASMKPLAGGPPVGPGMFGLAGGGRSQWDSSGPIGGGWGTVPSGAGLGLDPMGARGGTNWGVSSTAPPTPWGAHTPGAAPGGGNASSTFSSPMPALAPYAPPAPAPAPAPADRQSRPMARAPSGRADASIAPAIAEVARTLRDFMDACVPGPTVMKYVRARARGQRVDKELDEVRALIREYGAKEGWAVSALADLERAAGTLDEGRAKRLVDYVLGLNEAI